MNLNIYKFRCILSVLVILIVCQTNCTRVMPTYVHTVQYSSANKINLKVELRMVDEFRTTELIGHHMGDTIIYPMGIIFVHNAEELARNVFSDVIVTDGTGTHDSNVDAILIPKPVILDMSFPASSYGNGHLTIVLEWTLNDIEGNLVWIDTVKGEGVFKLNNKMFYMPAVNDVFQKSHNTISSSQVIRVFAKER